MKKKQIELPEYAATEPAEDRFYVVLSGLVPLIEDTDKKILRAYMLKIDDHAHLAGQWLFEQSVPKKLHVSLKGIPKQKTKESLEGKYAPLATIKKDIPDVHHSKAYACFDLPIPLKIHYLNRASVSAEDPNRELKDVPSSVSGTRVLEYAIGKKDFDIQLVDHDGHCWWDNQNRYTHFKNGKRVGALHLIDSPIKPMDENHNQKEYKLNLKLLGTKKVKLFDIGTGQAPDQPDFPDGLSNWECKDYFFRPLIAQYLTAIVRDGEPPPPLVIRGGGCEGCCAPSNGRKP